MDNKDFYEGQWSYPPQKEFHRPDPPQYTQYNKARKEKKENQGGLPIPMIVVGFFISPPLGVTLLLVHLYLTGKLSDKEKSRGYMDAVERERSAASQPRTSDNPKPKAKAKMEFQNPVAQKRFSKMSIALLVMGVLFLIAGVSDVVDAASWIQYMGGFANAYASDIRSLWGGLVTGLGGIGMVAAGWINQKNKMIRITLASIVGDAEVMNISQIAKKAGISHRACKKHLQTCIDQGYFGPDAYLDRSNDTLITSKADQALRNAVAREFEKPVEEPKTPEQAKSRYQEILDTLNALNAAIPGEEMTAKIDRLTAVSQKIFKLVEEQPDKLPQLRKFMDYYLPTALKLLTSYSQLDAQGVEGENITQAKQKIESAMDGLCTAFEAQLDKLFAADALDISTDISVMENMLKADGLSGDSDFDLKY